MTNRPEPTGIALAALLAAAAAAQTRWLRRNGEDR